MKIEFINVAKILPSTLAVYLLPMVRCSLRFSPSCCCLPIYLLTLRTEDVISDNVIEFIVVTILLFMLFSTRVLPLISCQLLLMPLFLRLAQRSARVFFFASSSSRFASSSFVSLVTFDFSGRISNFSPLIRVKAIATSCLRG